MEIVRQAIAINDAVVFIITIVVVVVSWYHMVVVVDVAEEEEEEPGVVVGDDVSVGSAGDMVGGKDPSISGAQQCDA